MKNPYTCIHILSARRSLLCHVLNMWCHRIEFVVSLNLILNATTDLKMLMSCMCLEILSNKTNNNIDDVRQLKQPQVCYMVSCALKDIWYRVRCYERESKTIGEKSIYIYTDPAAVVQNLLTALTCLHTFLSFSPMLMTDRQTDTRTHTNVHMH